MKSIFNIDCVTRKVKWITHIIFFVDNLIVRDEGV